MSRDDFRVRKAAVLGAGVMGAQIAAHFVNAGIPVLLYELPAADGDRNAGAARAVERLHALEPAPLAAAELAAHIHPANYDDHLGALAGCDLVIEAIRESHDDKAALYRRIAPHVRADAALVTNTSGLSLAVLADALPPALRARFCGMHFFNPPRYMPLAELIPGAATDPALIDALEAFLVTMLGKGVVRAKDTPLFIGNRVGVFSLLAVIHHAARLRIGPDTVDALTGPLIGRPRSASLRTLDVVGLDTFAHVVSTMREALAGDPWHRHFDVPAWMQALIRDGALGRKTGRGIYRKSADALDVVDPASGLYRRAGNAVDDAVADILEDADPAARFARLRRSPHPQARFLWSVQRDTFHYCAYHLAAIAHAARDVDLAMRWGYGWERGPFETWQAAGWQAIARALQEDAAAGLAMAAVPLPEWAAAPDRTAVHAAEGSYAPETDGYVPPVSLPVYRRQPYAERLSGVPARYGDALFETAAVCCWHAGDEVAVLSFKTRMHTIDDAVLDGVLQALEAVERRCAGLVIWQTEPPFSAGANLKRSREPGTQPSVAAALMRRVQRAVTPLALTAARRFGLADRLMAGRLAEIERLVARFQDTTHALRYADVPVVAAVDGMALGGGCELVMHCARAVAALESYPGLVEAGLGLIPAGGGCKELAVRAAAEARGGDVFPHVQRYFRTVATAQVARSAMQARGLGFLTPADPIVMNRHEILHVAKSEARALAEAGYRPPLPPAKIRVAGRSAIATLKAYMVNLREGERISEHDLQVGEALATVMCGGDVEPGSEVDERWLLDLERRHFMALIATAKTQERIEHMLKTGKPLRN